MSKPTPTRLTSEEADNKYHRIVTVESALDRLEKAAIAIGSCLVDGIDPDWDAQQEYEASAVHYVKALRGET